MGNSLTKYIHDNRVGQFLTVDEISENTSNLTINSTYSDKEHVSRSNKIIPSRHMMNISFGFCNSRILQKKHVISQIIRIKYKCKRGFYLSTANYISGLVYLYEIRISSNSKKMRPDEYRIIEIPITIFNLFT